MSTVHNNISSQNYILHGEGIENHPKSMLSKGSIWVRV